MKQALRVALYAVLAALIAAPFIAAALPFVTPGSSRAADFTLTDQDGKPFTLSRERGRAVVLFFGYTHCPDVCPTTLAALAQAYRQIGSPHDLQIVFVTVDPRRDSEAALRTYVRAFDPAFVGLRGDGLALQRVYKEYGVYAKIDADASSALGYSVTHSAGVYLIDKTGRLVNTLDWNATAQEFGVAFRKVV